jgi:hypothetical protein
MLLRGAGPDSIRVVAASRSSEGPCQEGAGSGESRGAAGSAADSHEQLAAFGVAFPPLPPFPALPPLGNADFRNADYLVASPGSGFRYDALGAVIPDTTAANAKGHAGHAAPEAAGRDAGHTAAGRVPAEPQTADAGHASPAPDLPHPEVALPAQRLEAYLTHLGLSSQSARMVGAYISSGGRLLAVDVKEPGREATLKSILKQHGGVVFDPGVNGIR